MSIVLRADQQTCMDGTRAALRRVGRVMLQAPTGAGKTVMGSYVTLGATSRGHRIMFTVHREELVRQTSKTMTRIGMNHGIIAAGYTPNPLAPVQVAMIDTLRNRLDRYPVPQLLLVDEAHHSTAKTWRKIIDYYAERGAKVIGLSATPCRTNGEPLRDVFDEMVLGPSIKHLIEIGALSRYSYFAPPVQIDTSGVHQRYGDFVQVELAAAADKPHITGDAIEHYRRLLPGKRAIVFAVNVAHSQHIAEQFRAAGIPAEHVDGETPPAERVKRLARFERGETLVLSNVALFTEGFDVPALDGVILLRPTASLSLYLQMVGRALRPHDSKERAIILDHCMNCMRHGLPDEDRDWTLDGKEKKKGKKKDALDINVVQCKSCYQVYEAGPDACPFCGHVEPKKARKGPEQVDGELAEITPEMAAALKAQRKAEIKKAKTLEELQEIEKRHGYKPGWADFMHELKSKYRARFQPPPPDDRYAPVRALRRASGF